MKNLIHEIHRRSLWQVLGIYLAGSWVALQVVEQLAEAAELPDWVRPLALVLLVIGLPIVLATAFVQEGIGKAHGHPPGAAETDDSTTPPGVRSGATPRTGLPEGRPGIDAGAHRWFTWRNAALAGVGALALWGLIAAGWMITRGGTGARGATEARPGDGPATASIAGAASTLEALPSIAALPFESLSPDERDRYFAEGIHDEILSELAQIETIRVVSRQSVLAYRGSERPIREIADSLGVDYVLEGTVRHADGRVRITAQLIDGETDRHVWSDTYEEELADVFRIQADVARRIAVSLGAEISPEVEERLASTPTRNAEAYAAFLEGKMIGTGVSTGTGDASEPHYRAAVQADPDFAAAHAWLALMLAERYWWRGRDPAVLEEARQTAEVAVSLDPDLPDGQVALGMTRYRALELTAAESALRRALELRPGDPVAQARLGHVVRRQGRYDDAVVAYERAAALDPRSAPYLDLFLTYLPLGRADDARRTVDLWTAVSGVEIYGRLKGLVSLFIEGDTAAANRILGELPEPISPRWHLAWIDAARLQRDASRVLELLSAFPELYEHPNEVHVRSAIAAEVHLWSGDVGRARASLDSAASLLEEALQTRDHDSRYHAAYARVLALRGDGPDALAAAERAVEMTPLARDFVNGKQRLRTLAAVQAQVGERDAALGTLETMAGFPGAPTVHELRLDPIWDPIREDPRFRRLVAGS